ncbi:YbhB/YbcL family Raf kinase inhibitor-like protein [Candidatus Pacearchaeota archaeon]|nr:YbhB/YbcL family Raf kinase inhibitor-like protein [Candidatus Pacearchaeota archaeon]
MKYRRIIGLVILFIIFAATLFSTKSLAEEIQIPPWVKNNAKWWSEGQIGDNDFVKGIQYLIQSGIMKIPQTQSGYGSSQQIPSWIKNNAGWWANGTITDDDFVKGIQYLIQENIIQIKTEQVMVLSSLAFNQFAQGEKIDFPQGITIAGTTGYKGPCPPSGTHRYFFKLYALDTVLDLVDGSTKDNLVHAMDGHILEQATLMGKYSKT